MPPLRTHWLFARQLFRRINIQRYYQRFAIVFSLIVICATLSAIKHYPSGGWEWPLIFYYVGVMTFTFGSVELILISFDKYKGRISKYRAIDRSISYYGVAITMIAMTELYLGQIF